MSQEQLQFLSGPQTPLMRQYSEIKSQCPDAILFYRLGDFYEMFYDDAIQASKILDIALTARDKSAKDPVPLCGVPYHSAKSYIAKLLDSGHKVAICEQIEDPALAKGIVKREIVKIITSGTRSDEDGLDSTTPSFILSLYPKNHQIALSWLDVSNGAIETTNFDNVDNLKNFILALNPSEIVHADDKLSNNTLSFLNTEFQFKKFPISKIMPWLYEQAEQEIPKRFNVGHVASIGLDPHSGSAETIVGLISYVEDKNKTKLPHLQIPKRFIFSEYVTLDYVTQENLELFESRRSVSGHSNLFSVLNHTLTGMGARELRNRIQKPLQNCKRIQSRLDIMDIFVQDTGFRNEIRSNLKTVTDIDRILRRLALRASSIHDLVSLRSTLKQVPVIRDLLIKKDANSLQTMVNDLDAHPEIYHLLQASIDDAPSFNVAEGGFIRDGFHKELDHCRTLSAQNQVWIADLEAQERKRTGIPSLKISYNRVFGYYIEITKVHHDKVPAEYIRKQTLVSAERYITPELKNKEEEIQSSKERSVLLEQEILNSIREKISKHIESLTILSQGLAKVDVMASLAHASCAWSYVRPNVTNEFALDIRNGRHPVVERNFSDGSFVPNDLSMDENARTILLTGPNMAGKSTAMRQSALIVLMAQMGCYVPADSATIGIVDRIFTRIGASDDLSGGRSTFMVEMNETSQILLNATSRSLILLDEIGRGTSTYDGLSIAWAVAEDIDQRIQAKTIFATHYHELTKLAQSHPTICLMRMAIREWKNQIVFLRKMEKGVTKRSYGIEVAELAGVRPDVILRAKEMMKNLESQTCEDEQDVSSELQKNTEEIHPVIQELRWLSIDEMSPKQALDYLFQLKNRLQK